MNLLKAKQTAAKLFGPGLKLHRGKNRCFVIRDGMPIGDGSSWLEALRSAGEMQMAKNAITEAVQEHVHKMIAAFKAKHPELPVEGLTEEQLLIYDAFVTEYEKTNPPPGQKAAPEAPAPTSAIPEIKRISAEEAGPVKPLVTLK